MGSEDPNLAYFGVFRGIKSSTFKYFGVGSSFGTTFGPPLDHFWTTFGEFGVQRWGPNPTQTTAK